MNKRTGYIVVATVVATLILSDKLNALPGLNKLPRV